jgi:tripeptide aminopeptidase
MEKDRMPVIDRNKLTEEFVEMTAVDSPSYGERQMADLLKKKLEKIGFSVDEDDAAGKIGGNAGNLYAFLPGTIPGDPILFSGHMDTVEPSRGKKAVRHENGRITSDGTTVLGADDLAGVTEILGGIRAVVEAGVPRRDIEVLFSPAEEVFTVGAAEFDYSRIRSKEAFCLDLSGHIGTAAIAAPSLVSFKVRVNGKAAHAGFEPEKGINAIAVAAKAISEIRQGRINPTTTLNLGTISGGTQVNIISPVCEVAGEARGYDHEYVLSIVDNVKKTFEKAAEEYGAGVDFSYKVHLHAYRNAEDDPALLDFRRACETIGISNRTMETFGGSDVNQYQLHGIDGLVISSGMTDSHTTGESLEEYDLENGARLVAALVMQN